MNISTTARRAIAGAATVLAAVGLVVTVAGPAAAAAGTASIVGHIWFDRDYDGVQSKDEPGYQRSGGAIVLYQDGQEVGYYDTDADGAYRIYGLAPGQYRIGNVDGGAYYSTTPIYQDVELAADDAIGVDFGIRGGVVAGAAWLDRNGDGIRDAGENTPDSAVEGAPVHLQGPAGLELDTTLDANGLYAFQDLSNGRNYEITAPTLPGLTFTSWDSGDSDIDPKTGRSVWMEIWQGTDHIVDMGYVAVS